ELLLAAGCAFGYDEELGGPVVTVDEWQRTTVPGVLAAGDGTGGAGSYAAEDHGRPAATRLPGDETPAPPARKRRAPQTAARASAASHASGGPRHLRAGDPGDGRLPMRGGVARPARAGDRGDRRRQRRQGLHACVDGPLPGAQLSAADRGDDCAAAWTRTRRRARRHAALARETGRARRDRGR